VRKRTFSDPNNKPGSSYEPSGGALPWGAIPLPVPLPAPQFRPAETFEPGWSPWADPVDKSPTTPQSGKPAPQPVPVPKNSTAGTPATNRQGVPATNPANPAPPAAPPQTPNTEGPCGGSPCGSAQLSKITQLDDKLSRGLGLGNAAGQVVDLALLGVINKKLGPELPGGLSGFMQGMQTFAARAWKTTQMDKVLNLLTFITTVHNAAMLSSNLGSTLSELTGLALQTIGIKDEEDNAIDVGSILGKTVESAVKGIVGEEVYNGTKTTWNKLNRIVQTASQVIWTVRSMADSAREVTEWTAENTGKIGNALKKWGIVGENAYKWMPERITAQNKWTRQVDKFKEGVGGIDDAASSLTGALSEVRSIQEEANELKDQKTEFDKAIKEAIPKDRVDNDKAKEKATQAKTASQSPDVSATPREKGDAP
jgi:hypothetical protein